MSNVSTRQKVGLVMAGLASAINIPSVLTPTGGEDQPGPPMEILLVDTVLGVVGLVAVVMAWRSGSRSALRTAAGTLVLIGITALPAFFVDVPSWVKLVVAVSLIYTVVCIVLMFSPARRPVPVLD